MQRIDKFADGSNGNHRLDAASVRAVDAYMGIIKRADRLIECLDEITIPGSVVVADFDDEDSLVIALADVPDPEHKNELGG